MSKYLIVDTETGGLDPQKHSLLEIAVVVWEDGKILDTFQRYVKEPIFCVTEEAMKINKINLTDVLTLGNIPSEITYRIRSFIYRNFGLEMKPKIVAHNAPFDIAFIKRLYLPEFQSSSNPNTFEKTFHYRSICTMSIAEFLMLSGKLPLEDIGLSKLLNYFKIDIVPERRHTALGDALATAELFTKLVALNTEEIHATTTSE